MADKRTTVNRLLAVWNELGWILAGIALVVVCCVTFVLSSPASVSGKKVIAPPAAATTPLSEQKDNVLWFDVVCSCSLSPTHVRCVSPAWLTDLGHPPEQVPQRERRQLPSLRRAGAPACGSCIHARHWRHCRQPQRQPFNPAPLQAAGGRVAVCTIPLFLTPSHCVLVLTFWVCTCTENTRQCWKKRGCGAATCGSTWSATTT